MSGARGTWELRPPPARGGRRADQRERTARRTDSEFGILETMPAPFSPHHPEHSSLRSHPGSSVEQPLSWRTRLGWWVESTTVQRIIISVILLNAVVLGLETSPALMDAAGPLLVGLDTACLAIFVVELSLKLTAFGWRFWRDPWNVFDFAVVAVALVPAGAGLDVLRALRVLRVLRLVSALPQLRKVVGALLHAIPGILSTGALLGLIFYVSAVMATTFFRESSPEYFGSMPQSLFTLFQMATLSSWEVVVYSVMEDHWWAWAFFVPFIILAAFTALNLIIAVIVDAMNTLQDMPSRELAAAGTGSTGTAEAPDTPRSTETPSGDTLRTDDDADPASSAADLHADIRALREEMADLRDLLESKPRA